MDMNDILKRAIAVGEINKSPKAMQESARDIASIVGTSGWEALKTHFAGKIFDLSQDITLVDKANDEMLRDLRKRQTTIRAYLEVFNSAENIANNKLQMEGKYAKESARR